MKLVLRKNSSIINTACDRYAVGGSGKPVYCTVPDVDHNVRVFGARKHQGVFQVRIGYGQWVVPTDVFTL